MEYNNYYSTQAGHPPPPPHMQPNQQQLGGGYSPQMQLMPGANNMMVGPGPPPMAPGPPQGMRQVVTPGPPPGHPQMQAQQPPLPPQSQQPPPMMGHPPHMQSPHQQHPGYHHPPPPPSHPHPLPPHSGSPHLNQQQPNINMNIQPPSRPSTGPSPLHPMHQQSPHLVGGPPPPPMHPQQQATQQLNHIGGPPSMPTSISQPQPGMQQHPHHQNFMSPGPAPGPLPPPPPQHPSPHYNQPNQHQPPPPPPSMVGPPGPPHNHAPQPQPPMHHHVPPPQTYLPHQQPHNHQPTQMDRGSPFYQNIPQTEFRIIELNKRLQNRPRPRGPTHPVALMDSAAESYWWEKFASEFFDNDATLTLRTSPDDKPVEYSIGRTLIPRFFRSYFEGGVVDLSIKLRNTRETVHHPHLITLDCVQTDITTKNFFKYRDTAMHVVVHTEGHLSLDFVSNNYDNLLIKSWRFNTSQCREYIDRTMTNAPGVPPTFLIEPVTRYGLTKQTIAYLKMCMIMEPMQELMLQHRQTHQNPRACLKQLLFDKYKLKSVEDNRAQPNRRRKRKTPAATGVNKKTKANANNTNAMNNNNNNNDNNIGFNNNMNNNSLMSSPTMHGAGNVGQVGGVVPNLSLASQDVMVVGEPSMLGADFGDENERRITRLENNQFDSSVNTDDSTNSNSNNNNNSNNSNLNNSNNVSQQNHNQMFNNTSNLNPNQTNNINHIQQQQQQQQPQQQQNNHDPGNIQMMNHMNNNNNNNNNSNNNKSSDSNNSNNNNGLQGGNNHQQQQQQQQQMNNLVSMNGNTNHMNHMIKQDLDLKQSTTTLTTVDSEQAR